MSPYLGIMFALSNTEIIKMLENGDTCIAYRADFILCGIE
jgi:hypothetical protein